MSVADKLLTLQEFERLPDDERYTELVRGRIVSVNPPKTPHGFVCLNVGAIYREHVRQNGLGRMFGNDTGVVTQRNPDTVRGAHVMFVSYQRLPQGPLPETYSGVLPELVFEVLSAGDRWSQVLEKVAEYLNAGVLVVCVVDPKQQKVHVFRSEQEAQVVTADEDLILPEVFGDFAVRVSEFFQ